MAVPQHKAALITGANTGLGRELARQLGLRGDFDKIYLACRNEIKARAAQKGSRNAHRHIDLRGGRHGG